MEKVTENKREISLDEAINICFIVFQKNIEEKSLQVFFEKALLGTLDFSVFKKEWYAFVLSAVYYGFAKYAPAYMVLEFVRSIKHMLKEVNYDDEQIINFLDNEFQAYISLVIEEKHNKCPEIFFKRTLEKELSDVNKATVAFISSAMAMLFATTDDIFEKYTYTLTS